MVQGGSVERLLHHSEGGRRGLVHGHRSAVGHVRIEGGVEGAVAHSRRRGLVREEIEVDVGLVRGLAGWRIPAEEGAEDLGGGGRGARWGCG